jgi:hypothetical protein
MKTNPTSDQFIAWQKENPFPKSKDEMKKVGEILFPCVDGKDVLVPHLLITKIPDFDEKKPVYAAHDLNGWLVSGKGKANAEALRLTQMTHEGNVWKARGMARERFHPAQLKNPTLNQPFFGGNIGWAVIESLYKTDDPFVDMSSGSPCLLVKDLCKP